MAIGQTPYNFTNTMSIQRATSTITGSRFNNIIHEEAGSLSRLLNQTFQDQFMYGNSAVRTFINADGDPEIERVDPRDIVTGRGLEDQIMYSDYGVATTSTTLSTETIRETLQSLMMQDTNSARTYTVLTGTAGMQNFNSAMQTYANTGWITNTNAFNVEEIKAELDIHKNSIYPMVSTKDYKTFEIRIQKENCDIVYNTNKGDKRMYDLLMKNAKRGVYMKMNKQDWKHEFK